MEFVAGSVLEQSLTALQKACINTWFEKATTMGCEKDKYQCYCTKREFRQGLKKCAIDCGVDVEPEMVEWRNIFCGK